MSDASLVRQNVDFEVAVESLAAYLGWLDREIHRESLLATPNEVKLLALRVERDRIVHERKRITPERLDLVGRAVFVYAPFVKAVVN